MPICYADDLDFAVALEAKLEFEIYFAKKVSTVPIYH